MAAQGVGWSTRSRRDKLLGRWVKVRGWMRFDVEPHNESENRAPGRDRNWESDCLEVHPSSRGDQPQSGRRMRGPDGSWSRSTSRPKTTEDWAGSSARVCIPRIMAWLVRGDGGPHFAGRRTASMDVHSNSRAGLALHFPRSDYRRLRSATDAIPLPEPKPRAMCVCLIVPSIRSRQIACGQGSGVRHGEDVL